MRTRLPLAACLLALALPTATAVATGKHDKPVVETRTFLLQVILSGNYNNTITETEADGYCNGTGQTATADFHLVGTAKLRVKLDTTKVALAVPVIDTTGSWQIDNAFTLEGDSCDMIQKSTCHGDVIEGLEKGNTNQAYAQGAGHYVNFGMDLQGPPTFKHDAVDCRNDEMITPPTDFSGLGVLGKYDLAKFGIKLVKLNDIKKGQTKKRSYGPSKGDPTLTDFVHTVSIKRLK